MLTTHNLTLPVTSADVEKLNIGDTVYLSGTVLTSRDMAHLNMHDYVDQNKPLPENLEGAVIFHAGPVMAKDEDGNWVLRVIGPTTSIRMEPHADFIGKLGVKIIIGKGGMAQDSREAFAKYKQVYLQACPGCAVLLADGIKNVKDVHWLEDGVPEAMWVFEADHFGPFIVTMDARGNSRYDDIKDEARKRAAQLLDAKPKAKRKVIK